MGIKDVIKKLKEKRDKKKQMLEEAKMQDRIQQKIEDMKKSSNERELEQLMDEEREKQIKQKLKALKKKKQNDIRYNHNPLDVDNITNKTEWEVMKERNMFKGNQGTVMHQKNLFTNNKKLFTSDSKSNDKKSLNLI